jgi:hypothetical protein
VNPETARRVVLISMGLMFAVTAMGKSPVKGGQKTSTYRKLWATGALGLLLSLLADFIPEIAGPFALLVALTYMMGAEATIADWLHAGIGSEPSSSSSSAPAKGVTPTQ